jgi:two-component system OmpR family sensor kinase
MKRTRSITLRLALVFVTLLLCVILLGGLSIGSLSYFNGVSSQVRDRWLPSTGALGDLNNLTSDFRAAEAARLLTQSQSDIAASEHEMQELDRGISLARGSYTRIRHDATEDALYAHFASDWQEYRLIVTDIQKLSAQGDRASAIALYNTTSKQAYDAASDTLGLLTDRNLASARQASLREDQAYIRARRWITLTILLAGLSVGGAMVYVQRAISAPLLRLAGRMHTLATHGTGIEIEGTERQDEIGEMARAVVVFRNNAIELTASRHGLEQQALMLQEKLAEEQRLMGLQRNFVSMASHEFRTPLTIVDAHAQRLISMKDRLEPNELAERTGRIRSAVLRMTQLIQNLIDSARIIDGDVALYFHPVRMDLNALLHEVCHAQREMVAAAQILESFGTAPLYITADSNLLFQVFNNLLSNAVKYSRGTSFIDVSAVLEGTCAVVSVADRGIGIPEDDCERIFERYYRGRNATGITGTGVGLYFVKVVVDHHHGAVAAENRGGGGSRFTVRLPLEGDQTSSSSFDKNKLTN